MTFTLTTVICLHDIFTFNTTFGDILKHLGLCINNTDTKAAFIVFDLLCCGRQILRTMNNEMFYLLSLMAKHMI